MMVASAALVGKWRIMASRTWPCDQLDLCGPAFLRIDADDTGEIAFNVSIGGGFTAGGIDFGRNGANGGHQVTGTVWAGLCND